MNGRSGVATIFLFLFLAVMILLQVLTMVQSDRLFGRLNHLAEIWRTAGPMATTQARSDTTDLPGEEYPGDAGDWLVWRIGAEPATLNPITRKDVYATWVVSGNIFESFLEYDLDKVRLKPLLAESYEVSDDGLEISFRIRDDVHFSDGHPIGVDDVIFSYETIINPKIDAHNLANYYKDVDRVVRISDREVKFIMKRTYFKALEFLGGMDILPKHIYEFSDPADFNKHRSDPVGSGPYVFEKWNVGREIVLRRNEQYWGRKPKLKKIVFRIITNEVAALQALRSGQIDFIRPEPEQFAELRNDQEFKNKYYCLLYWDPGVGYRYVGWNQDTPFFKDRRVRLAMTHIVNRKKIIQYLLKGLGREVTGPFYILGKQNNPNIEPWLYDPQQAKQLLGEAGWIDTDGDGIRDKDGIPLRFKLMIVSQVPFHERLAKLLKDEAAKIGIEIVPDPYEWSIFVERLNTRSFEATTLAWGGVVESDPYQIWHSSQIVGRGSNRIGFADAEADAIIEEARRTLDENKRNKLYHRFHQILHEQQPYTFLLTRPWLYFLDKRFENVKIHKLGLDPLEWYVPKAKQKYK